MLSDETISNIRLHRDTRLEPNSPPFIVPTNNGPKRLAPPQQQQRRVASSRSSKSAQDAKRRAVSDSCMAAAIGDLQWLKQSLKDGHVGDDGETSVEQTYGKEGLAPIHLAALHGRINCLSYLIEIVHIDIDLPSQTGWRPLHLCISRETGARAFHCLQYLIAQNASINITNDDKLTPLHQAASEGHVQCTEFLLAHNADVYAEDSRKQLPIDLAKLWGNKKCAKLLAAGMWHQNKHLTAKERLVSRNAKMADILLEIKRDHAVLFEEKAEEKFDQWLLNMGASSGLPAADNESSKPSTAPAVQERQQEPAVSVTLPSISQEHLMSQAPSSQKTSDKRTIPKRVRRSPTVANMHRWNTSIHVKPNPYVPDLVDTYPRDPFTRMPIQGNAVDVYRLLKGMTLADVKKFLGSRKQQSMAAQTKRSHGQHQERPVVYEACHVDDLQTLHRPVKGEDAFRPLQRVDESGLHLTDDATKSVFYRQLAEAMNGGEDTALARQQFAEEKAKWALFEQYGPELVEFLTDRRGRFKRQYDKVFIT